MQHRPHDELMALVQSFFREHLACIRGASPRTILAYRDAVRLFLWVRLLSVDPSLAALDEAQGGSSRP